MRQSRRARALATLLALGALACGRKGAPLPPVPERPAPVVDLSARPRETSRCSSGDGPSTPPPGGRSRRSRRWRSGARTWTAAAVSPTVALSDRPLMVALRLSYWVVKSVRLGRLRTWLAALIAATAVSTGALSALRSATVVLGLILASSSTPEATTASEVQRIAFWASAADGKAGHRRRFGAAAAPQADNREQQRRKRAMSDSCYHVRSPVQGKVR